MTSVNRNFELLSEMSEKGIEAARQLGEINLRAMEQLVGRQMDAVSLAMDTGLQQAKMASEATAYSDLLTGQVELAKGLSERLMQEGRNNVKLATDTREEYRAWFAKGMNLMREKVGETQNVA